MCKKRNNNKLPTKLLVLGNGFDLSLGLRSSFNNYIHYNGLTNKSKFFKTINFIRKYKHCVNELSGDLTQIVKKYHRCGFPILLNKVIEKQNKFYKNKHNHNIEVSIILNKSNKHNDKLIDKIKKIFTKKSPDTGSKIISLKLGPLLCKYNNEDALLKKLKNDGYNTKYIRNYLDIRRKHLDHNSKNKRKVKKINVTPRQWVSNYFNIKSKYNYFSLGLTSFEKLQKRSEVKHLGKDLLLFNKKCVKDFNYLRNAAINITDVNFWDMLISIQGYFHDKESRIVNGYGDWCDIENMIKDFIISIYDFPVLDNSTYKFKHRDYFLKDPSSYNTFDDFPDFCFDFYVYINRYLDILNCIPSYNSYAYSYDNGIKAYEDNNSAVANCNNIIDKKLQRVNKEYIQCKNKYNISFDKRSRKISISKMRHLYSMRSKLEEKKFTTYKSHYDSYDLYYDLLLNEDSNELDKELLCNTAFNDNLFNILDFYPIVFLMLNDLKYYPAPNTLDVDSYNSLFTFLHQQLLYFEDDFSQYLRTHLKKDYVKESYRLQQKISHNKNFAVLDFNYTPLNPNIVKDHIHGSLNHRNILIGIGDSEINRLWFGPNDRRNKLANKEEWYNLFSFTKTYRLLEMTRSLPKSEREFNRYTLKNINNIIFFGHSLGINDYPYFKALFDGIDLYNSNVVLTFCYCKHYSYDNSTRRMRQQLPAIVELLKRYGNTLESNSHKKSLITKMLIEHRIKLYDASNDVNDVYPFSNRPVIKSDRWRLVTDSDSSLIIYIQNKSSDVINCKERLSNIYYSVMVYSKNHIVMGSLPNKLVIDINNMIMSNHSINVSYANPLFPINFRSQILQKLKSYVINHNNINIIYCNSVFTFEFSDNYANTQYVSITYINNKWTIEYIGNMKPYSPYFLKN